MGKLGDFLERFYSPDETFRSVHARVRRTQSQTPVRPSAGRRRRSIGRPSQGPSPKPDAVSDVVMWGRLPDQVRIEARRENDDQIESTLEIVNGLESWKRYADGTVEKDAARARQSDGPHRLPTVFQRHFDRRLIRECFAALTLESIGECQVAGRECLKIRAVQIPGAQLWPHWFSFETGEFELAADVQRAVLLAIRGVADGTPVDAHEVMEVEFDGELDASLFEFQADAGEVIQAATPVTEQVSLEVAAARAPFVVFTPGYVPNRDQMHEQLNYHPSRPGSRRESLTTFYIGGRSAGSLGISQGQSDDGERDQLEWEDLSAAGQEMQLSDPETDDGLRVLRLERAGTEVQITSDLPREELVKIASSLTPVERVGNG